jgi:hypothetical protein
MSEDGALRIRAMLLGDSDAYRELMAKMSDQLPNNVRNALVAEIRKDESLIAFILGRLGFPPLWSGDYHQGIREALDAHLLRLQLAEAVVEAVRGLDRGADDYDERDERVERALNAYDDQTGRVA